MSIQDKFMEDVGKKQIVQWNLRTTSRKTIE